VHHAVLVRILPDTDLGTSSINGSQLDSSTQGRMANADPIAKVDVLDARQEESEKHLN